MKTQTFAAFALVCLSALSLAVEFLRAKHVVLLRPCNKDMTDFEVRMSFPTADLCHYCKTKPIARHTDGSRILSAEGSLLKSCICADCFLHLSSPSRLAMKCFHRAENGFQGVCQSCWDRFEHLSTGKPSAQNVKPNELTPWEEHMAFARMCGVETGRVSASKENQSNSVVWADEFQSALKDSLHSPKRREQPEGGNSAHYRMFRDPLLQSQEAEQTLPWQRHRPQTRNELSTRATPLTLSEENEKTHSKTIELFARALFNLEVRHEAQEYADGNSERTEEVIQTMWDSTEPHQGRPAIRGTCEAHALQILNEVSLILKGSK
jgi:hypothetical protein